MNICTLIPIYNEAKNIAPIVRALKDKGLPVVIVDDGSDDDGGKLALDQGAEVLRNIERSGKGKSLQRGIEYILQNKYDGVIILDGDGQHSPDDVDLFLDLAKAKNAKIIVGNRLNDTKDMPWIRVQTNRFMSWMISRACKQSIPDTQCGYRYLSTAALCEMPLVTTDYEIETEMLIEASRKNWPVYSVSIETIYEDERSHVHPIRDTIRFLKYFLKAIKSK